MKFSQFFLTKKKPLALILGVSMFFLAAAVSAPSLAWFIEIQDKANTTSMSGVIHGAYFGGSGTSGDPYTISQPKQIYYFNWLQDIGYFNLVNKEGVIVVELYINNSKELFDSLFEKREEIESKLGFALEWDRLDSKKAARIKYYIDGLNFDDHSNYNALMNETVEKAVKMRDVFKQYI